MSAAQPKGQASSRGGARAASEGARVALANAGNALQIHCGNGCAQEYKISRVLCDARILNIFEGAAEIHANIIARGLLSGRNLGGRPRPLGVASSPVLSSPLARTPHLPYPDAFA